MDSISNLAEESRKDAQQKYQEEQQKFSLQMMMMGYYKIKSLLTEEGLKKVAEIDLQRETDELFNAEFSESIWKITEEAWSRALEQMMIKLNQAYGLEIGKDIFKTSDKNESDLNSDLDFYV